MPKYTKAQKEEARERLTEWLRPEDTIFCILRHVSKSGMSRNIDFFLLEPGESGKCEPVWLSPHIAKLFDSSYGDDGIRVTGGGMDMGFHVVYELSHALSMKLSHRWL